MIMNNEFNKLHIENTRMFLKSTGTISIGSVSKLLQKCNIKMGRNRFYDFLIKNGYVQKNKNRNKLTQKSIDLGIMKLEKQNPVITPKGCFFFWMLLRENSINNIADKEENVLAYLAETEPLL